MSAYDGLAGFGLAGHDFFQEPATVLDLTRRLGIRHLDFWHHNRGELSPTAYAELMASYDVAAYTVNIDTSNGRFGGVDIGAAGAAFNVALEEAVAFGARYLQIYLAPPGTDRVADRVALLADSLRPYAERAAESGVLTVIENNFDHRVEDPRAENVARSAAVLMEVVDALGPELLGLTYDPANTAACGTDVLTELEALRPAMVNLHIKDCLPLGAPPPHGHHRLMEDGERSTRVATPVGAGTVPWAELLGALGDFSGWLTLDPFTDSEHVYAWCQASLMYLDEAFGLDPQLVGPEIVR
jgi:sugar phosphate isomerase/epimerase